MRISHLVVSLSALLIAGSAFAADTAAPTPMPMPTRVRGTIQAMDATSITIKGDDGSVVTAAFGDKTTRLSAVEARTFAQLKPTDFVGITSSPGKNGHLQAEEIHIIPIVGLGEGTYPWDHHPATAKHAAKRAGSMTNGSIAPVAKKAGSMTNGTLGKGDAANELKVSYRGSDMVDGKCTGHAPSTPTGGCVGSSIVDVTPETQIAAITGAQASDLKVGNFVVASSINGADGKPLWISITTEKNGVKPAF
jgi:hypothetical protein